MTSRQIVLKSENGRVLRVSDVAAVHIGSLTRYGAVTKDGNGETVQGLVLSLRGANASAVVKAVRAKLDELQASMPKGVTLNVFYDRADLIQRAVGTVSKALIEATALVVVLLLLFLGNLRAAVVVAVTLPMAALITFLMMQMFGMTANLMSLGGLAIAIGLIVDAAVVVVENTEEWLSRPGQERLPFLHCLYHAASEVAVPVASGIIIICLVFLPLLSLQGLEGKLFAPVAMTIIMALSGSLLLSLTFIPVLGSLLLRRKAHANPLLMRILEPAYSKLLSASLRRPWPVYAAACGGAALAVVAYLAVGKTFMPSMDEGSAIMQTTKLASIGLPRSIETDTLIQRALRERVPEIKQIIARTGADELGLDPMGLNETDVFLVLKPKEEWRVPDKEWLLQQLRDVMADLPGREIAFTQPIEMRTAEMLTGARGDLAVKLFGPDLKKLSELAGQIKETLAKVQGASEVITASNAAVDYLEVKVDRMMAGRTRLSVARIEDELRALLEGAPAGIVSEGGRRTTIVIRGPADARDAPEQFALTQLAAGDGGLVRVSDVAKISEGRRSREGRP